MRNQSLANLATLLILSLGLLAGMSASATEPVYKWIDGSGHSHYSQTPPEGQRYQTITMAGSGSVPEATQSKPVTSEQRSSASTDSPTPAQAARGKLCESARANVTTLTTHATVLSDVNSDGKPVALNAAQHDAALDNANKQVDLYCTK